MHKPGGKSGQSNGGIMKNENAKHTPGPWSYKEAAK